MSWESFLVIYILVLLLLLASGVWIAFALALTGVLGLFLKSGFSAFHNISIINWNSAESFTLTAVPLFLFMGEIILRSGLSNEFYQGLSTLLYRLPGGLIHSNIMGCAVFSAISGSSVATAAAIGTAAIPQLRKDGYSDSLTLGSLAAGGTLGILIPPSIVMIIYGDMVQESVAKLFIAGIVPGIILVFLFMGFVFVRSILDPSLAPKDTRSIPLMKRVLSFARGWPILTLMIGMLGGIYLGVTTPTEAAAAGAACAVIIGLALKRLNLKIIKEALASAVKVTIIILFIYEGASVFSFALVNAGISRGLVEAVIALQLGPQLFLIFIVILYLILGCFIDGISMMILTLPLLFPIVMLMKFDPIWFGVIMTILIEVGQITPPMGVNLFIIHSIAGGISMKDVIMSCAPYWFILLGFVVLLSIWPSLATFLPLLIAG